MKVAEIRNKWLQLCTTLGDSEIIFNIHYVSNGIGIRYLNELH